MVVENAAHFDLTWVEVGRAQSGFPTPAGFPINRVATSSARVKVTECSVGNLHPSKTRGWRNCGYILGQRRRCWPRMYPQLVSA